LLLPKTDPDLPRDRRKGITLAILGMLAVSTDSLFIRLADTEGFDVTFWIGAFTAIVLTVALTVRDKQPPLGVVRRGGWMLWLAGALQAGSTCTFVLAVTKTSVANVVVIIAAAPLIAAVLSTVLLKERSPRRVWLAAGVVIVGVIIVVSGSFGGGALLGDLLAVVAITLFGCALVLLRRFPDIDRLAMVLLGGVGMAAVSFIPASLFGHSSTTWLALALMGLVFGPLARLLIAEAPKHLPAAEVGLFAPVETVAASVWAWLFFAEAPAARTVVGGLIIVAAVLWGTKQATTAGPRTLE